MTTVVLKDLLELIGLFVVAAITLGVVFDKIAPGPWRNALVGLLCGVYAGLAMAMPLHLGNGFMIDGRSPYIIVAGLFGGPVGLAAALPIPLAVRIGAGGPAVLIGVAAILTAGAIGLIAHLVLRWSGRPLCRSAVAVTALAAPLTLLSIFVPHLAPRPGMFDPFLLPLLVWTPFATLIFGLCVSNELTRSDSNRLERESERFERSTRLVSPAVLSRHLHHQFELHEFCGTPHAYMLIAIDDAAGLRSALGARAFAALREAVARQIRAKTRRLDVVAALDTDRFGVLLPQTDRAAARPIAIAIQGAVAALRPPGAPVTVSIGMADVANTSRAEDVEAAAEGALFLANAVTPRGAIGPVDLIETTGPLVRSFPGAAPPLGARPPAALADPPAGHGPVLTTAPATLRKGEPMVCPASMREVLSDAAPAITPRVTRRA